MRRGGGGGGDYSGLEERCLHGSNLFRLDMAAERAPSVLAHADTQLRRADLALGAAAVSE